MRSFPSFGYPRLSRALFLRVFAIALGTFVFAAHSIAGNELNLTVMSYNVRVPLDKTPYTWPERRDAVVECIQTAKPDLIGIQEGLLHQLEDLAERLPEYGRLGQGREGGTAGEYSALLYRRARFSVVDHGDFWLSDTPTEAGSRTWGNKLPRMVSWARLRENESNREFHWFNTHFDHQSQPSRERSAELLRARAAAVDEKTPVIITGDFNAVAGENPAYSILTTGTGLIDTWTAAKEREGEGLNSFNGFATEPERGGKRIDWVLVRGKAEVTKAALLTCQKEGRFPSDHFPAVAWLRLLE